MVEPTWFHQSLVTSTGGTATRTLAARFADVVNVKDFGATGNGTTNDTAALQAAIDAGAGRALFFPPGTYRTSRLRILAGDARQIIGVPGQSILKSTDTNADTVLLLSTSAVTDTLIEGLTFDGNSTVLTGFVNVVQIFNSQRVHFRNCAFQNTRGITLLMSTSIQNCTVENCRFLNCGYTGTVVTDRKQALAFVGATAGGTDSYGNMVLNNTFENIGLDCIAWQDQNYGVVSGNRCNVTGAGGVYCWNSRHSVISGNVIRTGSGVADPFASGIDVPASTDITIIGNVCFECSADGIGIYGGTTNCTVVGNTCINNDLDASTVKRAGIYVRGSGHTVTGNTCTDTQSTKTQDYGIIIDTAATNIVVDESNNLFGNGVSEIGYCNRSADASVITATATIGRVISRNSGTAVVLTADGSAANLDLTLTAKGSGVVRSAGALNAGGTVTAPTFAGALTGNVTGNAATATALSAGADRTKLDSIAAGATVNSTDAALRDRTTHTGAQAISTVTGLQTALDAKAPLASPSFTGTTNAVIVQAASSLELGSVSGVGNTPFIDFHAGATVTDYDCRIIATAGTGTTGQGTLTYSAGSHAYIGKVAMTLTNAVDDAAAAAAGVALGQLYRNGSAVMIRVV